MSFILDALKKSEAERSRLDGPNVLEFRPARAPSSLPWWAVVLAVALLANLALLTWALLRDTPAATPASAPAALVPSGGAPPAAAAALPEGAAPPLDELRPVLPDPARATTPLPAASGALPPTAPLPASQPVPAQPVPAQPRPAANLPTAQDLLAAGAGVPELRISLHVYDVQPTNRYVLLNGVRLREGEATADGLRLLEVTEAGVVLEWRGRRFSATPGS